MMQKQLRWGVLGYAGIARKHLLPAMMNAENAIPYAIASRDAQKLAGAQRKFGFQKLYSNYEDLLKDPEVDAVYIPLPNALHKEWTIKAARYGKHILCEKPLALSAADCEEMIAACKQHQVLLMEAFMYRFTPRIKKMTELLRAGVIGDVKHINSTHRFLLKDDGDVRVNAALGGGCLRDIGCYPLNIIGLIVQDTPQDFCALKTEFQGVDHAFSAVLRYPNGVMATVNAGFDAQCTLLTEINGTKGSMLVRDSFGDSDLPIVVVLGESGETVIYPVEACDRYQLEVEDFSDAVLTGRSPLLTLDETVRNNRLIEALLQAAR